MPWGQKQVEHGPRRLDAGDARAPGQHLARPSQVAGPRLAAHLRKPPLQGGRGVAADELAAVHQAYTVAAFRFVQVGSRDKYGHALLNKLVQKSPEVPPRDGVHAISGFIQKKHAGTVQQRAHECQLLLHPSGELSGVPRAEGSHARHVQKPGHQLAAFRLREAEQIGVKAHVLVHREVHIKPEALRHVPDAVFHCVRVARDIMPIHPGLSRRRVEQAAEQPEGRGLPRAIRPDQSEYLPPRHSQVQSIHGSDCAEAPGEISRLNHGQCLCAHFRSLTN